MLVGEFCQIENLGPEGLWKLIALIRHIDGQERPELPVFMQRIDECDMFFARVETTQFMRHLCECVVFVSAISPYWRGRRSVGISSKIESVHVRSFL